MNTSLFPWLKKIDTIVLSAGHGAKDPGACNSGKIEKADTIYLVDHIAEILDDNYINVIMTPDELDSSVNWVNQRYKTFYSAWAIEIHRDSAIGIDQKSANYRCGCYYGTSAQSRLIADQIKLDLKKYGAASTSWARSDTKSKGGKKGLEWIRKTKPLAHLLELGFMQGDSSVEHLNLLAKIAAESIYHVFCNKELEL